MFDIHRNKLVLEFGSLDILKEAKALSTKESAREVKAHSQLSLVLEKEKIFWRQRSRVNWLREGDPNTKFFHTMANGHRNHKHISRILLEKTWVENDSKIGVAFSNHFHSLYGTKKSFHFLDD